MTWKEFHNKYPNGKCGLSKEKKEEYMEDCFTVYEDKGFSDSFNLPFGDLKNRNGSEFIVTRRCEPAKDQIDDDAMPAWEIMFADGFTMIAFPDEICIR